jgi:RNA polymerase sigma factor for flagellar operon FliA
MQLAQDLERRNSLVVQYRPYVEKVVGHLMRSFHLPVDRRDEFIAAGYLGLVEAASRFDFRVGKPFKSYAFLRIRGAVIDGIRTSTDLGGRAYRRARAIQAAHDLREQMASEPDSPQRTAQSERLARILDFAAKATLTFRLSMHDIEVEVAERSDSPRDPAEIFETAEVSKKMRGFVATLPKKERNVITDYYFRGMSFSEIAERYGGYSKSWVSRVHRHALDLLHERVVAYHAGLPEPVAADDVRRSRSRHPRGVRSRAARS